MEVRNPEDLERYLAHNGTWLLGYGLQRLPDRALVEDAIQELMAWALVGVARGLSFNSHYLGLRFRSLLRDARRGWTRLHPPAEDRGALSVEARLDARAALARLASLPDGPLMVDTVRLGVQEAAARYGLSADALHVRTHRFRQRYADLAPDLAA